MSIKSEGAAFITLIGPNLDLCNSYNDIPEFCHKYGEPVEITKNGTAATVARIRARHGRRGRISTLTR